jgi:hypothetical protein
MKRQKTNFFTLIIISLVSVSFAQEKPNQFFTEPQPSESSSSKEKTITLNEIPKELIGEYKDNNGDCEVVVKRNAIYIERKVKVTLATPKDPKKSPYTIESVKFDDGTRNFLSVKIDSIADNNKLIEIFNYTPSQTNITFYKKESYPLILNSNLVIKEIDKGNYVVSVKNPANGLWQVASFVVYTKNVSIDFYSFNNAREILRAHLNQDTKLNNLKVKSDDNDYYTTGVLKGWFKVLKEDNDGRYLSKIFDVDVLSGKIDIK